MSIWLLDDDLDWSNVLNGSIAALADFRDCGCRLPPITSGAVPLLAGRDLGDMRPSASTNQEPTKRALECNVLIKQTAKYPIAYLAPSPMIWFRNSVIGCYAEEPEAIVAHLNSDLIRELYVQANRGIREGIPQITVSALRRLPIDNWATRCTNEQRARLWLFGSSAAPMDEYVEPDFDNLDDCAGSLT